MGSYWTGFWPISVLDLVIGPGNLTCHVIKLVNGLNVEGVENNPRGVNEFLNLTLVLNAKKVKTT